MNTADDTKTTKLSNDTKCMIIDQICDRRRNKPIRKGAPSVQFLFESVRALLVDPEILLKGERLFLRFPLGLF